MILLILCFILLSASSGAATADSLAQQIEASWAEFNRESSARERAKLNIMLKKFGYGFEKFPVRGAYSGNSVMPDFSGRDRRFAYYRTLIRETMKARPNFARKYSMIQIGCGSDCSTLYVGDHSNGRIVQFPRGAGKNSVISIHHQVDSRLLIVRWQYNSAYSEGTGCFWEAFDWRQNKPKLLKKLNIKDQDLC